MITIHEKNKDDATQHFKTHFLVNFALDAHPDLTSDQLLAKLHSLFDAVDYKVVHHPGGGSTKTWRFFTTATKWLRITQLVTTALEQMGRCSKSVAAKAAEWNKTKVKKQPQPQPQPQQRSQSHSTSHSKGVRQGAGKARQATVQAECGSQARKRPRQLSSDGRPTVRRRLSVEAARLIWLRPGTDPVHTRADDKTRQLFTQLGLGLELFCFEQLSAPSQKFVQFDGMPLLVDSRQGHSGADPDDPEVPAALAGKVAATTASTLTPIEQRMAAQVLWTCRRVLDAVEARAQQRPGRAGSSFHALHDLLGAASAAAAFAAAGAARAPAALDTLAAAAEAAAAEDMVGTAPAAMAVDPDTAGTALEAGAASAGMAVDTMDTATGTAAAGTAAEDPPAGTADAASAGMAVDTSAAAAADTAMDAAAGTAAGGPPAAAAAVVGNWQLFEWAVSSFAAWLAGRAALWSAVSDDPTHDAIQAAALVTAEAQRRVDRLAPDALVELGARWFKNLKALLCSAFPAMRCAGAGGGSPAAAARQHFAQHSGGGGALLAVVDTAGAALDVAEALAAVKAPSVQGGVAVWGPLQLAACEQSLLAAATCLLARLDALQGELPVPRDTREVIPLLHRLAERPLAGAAELAAEGWRLQQAYLVEALLASLSLTLAEERGVAAAALVARGGERQVPLGSWAAGVEGSESERAGEWLLPPVGVLAPGGTCTEWRVELLRAGFISTMVRGAAKLHCLVPAQVVAGGWTKLLRGGWVPPAPEPVFILQLPGVAVVGRPGATVAHRAACAGASLAIDEVCLAADTARKALEVDVLLARVDPDLQHLVVHEAAAVEARASWLLAGAAAQGDAVQCST